MPFRHSPTLARDRRSIMTQRRGKKEGTIFKRKNGTWRAQITLDGKRLSHTGQTYSECREWIRETQRRLNTGLTFAGSQIKLGEYLSDWLETTKATVRPKTWRQYKQIANDYILPSLGRIKIMALRPDQIQRVYDQLLREGKGRRTVQLVHAVIHRSLAQAVKLGLLGRNPDDATSPPKPKKREVKILDQGQVHRLLIAARTRGFGRLALFHLALVTGMRQGELLALKWDDLDLTAKSLQVKRQLKRVPGGGFNFAPPKTKAGYRTIRLGDRTTTILKRYYQVQLDVKSKAGEVWQEHGLVYPSTVGTPLNPRNVVRTFKKLLADAGLPEIRFHDLRHTAASIMLNNGIDVLIVSKRLGHSKPSITLDIYGHLIAHSQEKAAELVDTLITPISFEGFAPTAPELHQDGKRVFRPGEDTPHM